MKKLPRIRFQIAVAASITAFVLGVLSVSDVRAQVKPPAGDPAPKPTSAPAGKVVGWRGDGTGVYPKATPPLAWSKDASGMKNIHWAAAMPGPCVGQPIIVGDKIFAMADYSDLVCLDKKTGKILWVRSNNYFDTLNAKEASLDTFKPAADAAKQLKAINDTFGTGKEPDDKQLAQKWALERDILKAMTAADKVKYKYPLDPQGSCGGATAPTPISDGKHVYVWLGSGVAACYDLDGARKWIRLDNHDIVEHGFNSSPTLAGGKLIVYMRELVAFDTATGAVAWRITISGKEFYTNNVHSSLLTVKLGQKDYVVVGTGQIVNAENGTVASRAKDFSLYATPVLDEKNNVHAISAFGRFSITALDGSGKAAVVREANVYKSDIPNGMTVVGSPVQQDGILYYINCQGEVTALDESNATIIYSQKLDLGAKTLPRNAHANYSTPIIVDASLAIAGKYIYAQGVNGVTVIFEVGKEFKQVARNTITQVVEPNEWRKHQEIMLSAPIFEGDRMYLRGEKFLYCIGEK